MNNEVGIFTRVRSTLLAMNPSRVPEHLAHILTFFPFRNGKAKVMISPTERRAFGFMNNPERLKFLSLPSLKPFFATKNMCPE